MKGKLITLCIAMLASVSLISLTACGSNEEAAVSSSASSTVTSETSASLGIYIYDTDNDGTPDKVVDRYGADLSELYTLKEDGIYAVSYTHLIFYTFRIAFFSGLLSFYYHSNMVLAAIYSSWNHLICGISKHRLVIHYTLYFTTYPKRKI